MLFFYEFWIKIEVYGVYLKNTIDNSILLRVNRFFFRFHTIDLN